MTDGDNCLTFGTCVPCNHPNAAQRQKQKPEVEMRCAGPIYFENGNTYNSAAGYDIGTNIWSAGRKWRSTADDVFVIHYTNTAM